MPSFAIAAHRLFLRCALMLGLLAASALPARAADISVTYVDAQGVQHGPVTATVLTSGGLTTLGAAGTTTWYVCTGTVTYTDSLVITGNVNLILADACVLSATGTGTAPSTNPGIDVSNNHSLTIWAASPNAAGNGPSTAGSVTARGASNPSNGGAGIGSGLTPTVYPVPSGAITIHGGTVTAFGGRRAAGIGSGEGGTSAPITIDGGMVNATGGNCGAGIGTGDYGTSGAIMIVGSATVNAKGGDGIVSYGGGAGIGSGASAPMPASITINTTGTVQAQGGGFQAGFSSHGGSGADIGQGGSIYGGVGGALFPTHTVTGLVGSGSGSITPTSVSHVAEGSSVSFTMTPATGWMIGTVWVDGSNVTGAVAGNTYRLPVTGDNAVEVTFTLPALNPADLRFTPTSTTYNQTYQSVTVSPAPGVSGMGAVTAVYYNGSPTAPANAGSYIITVDVATGASYAAATGLALGTFTINKATLTAADFIFAPDSATYDGTAQSVTVSPAPGVSGIGAVTVYYNGSATAPTHAGSYAITVDVAEGTNYTAATGLALGTFTIGKTALTAADFSFAPASVTYDGTAKSVTVSPTAALAGAGFDGSVSAVYYNGSATAPTDAGSYAITVDITGGTNHNNATGLALGTFTIQKATPTITGTTGLTATYGQTLADVGLTVVTASVAGAFAWEQPGTSALGSVAASPNTTYTLRFTPTDTANYNTVTGIATSIAVSAISITAAAITVTAPVTGATPATAVTACATNTTCGTVAWSPNATTFAGGTQYTATVTLTANTNYTFTGLGAATINGQTATVTNNTGGTVTLAYQFPATAAVIANPAITVTAPATGATPATAVTACATNTTCGAVAWSPSATPFAGGTQYTATVTLTAASGYTFTGLTGAILNGQTATVTNNTGGTVTLSYQFPTTAAVIASADVTVTAPTVGAVPGGATPDTGSHFSVDAVAWSPNDPAFLGDTPYTVTVTLKADSGYTFTGLPAAAARIDSQAATVTNNTGEQVMLTYVFAALVASADVTITAPAAGAAPDTAASGTGHFSVSAVTWTPADSPFKAGTTYTAELTLTADSGYTFDPNFTATLNGKTATVKSNDGATVVLEIKFQLASASATAVPTLSEWALALLALLLTGVAWQRRRG